MFKVMIVDDDINVCACLRALIPWDSIGCELVACAGNGREGYAMAIEHAPDVIICDIVMPQMDGATLCKRVYETMSDVTFLFLSAYEDFTTAQLALKYHVRDYILKPIDRSKVNYITQLLRNIAQKRENDSYYMRILHDADTEAGIRRALEIGDAAYFERLFQRFTADANAANLDISHIRDVAYRLLNLLFAHLRFSGAPDAEPRRAEAFRTLETLKFKMDLIFFASELYFSELRPDGGARSTYCEALAEEVSQYIDANFQDPSLCAASVASRFHYSADYLGRLFSQYQSVGISARIAERRVERAAALLVDGGLPVGDVTAEAGYVSASYFARAFKKRFGMTPSEYRARYARAEKETRP